MTDATADREWPGLVMPAQKPEWNAWPGVDPGKQPIGPWILVQYKCAQTRTKGGILLSDESRESDQYAMTAARVVSMGEMVFRDEITGEHWAGGDRYGVGDFIRCPLTGGDQFEVDSPQGKVRFGFWRDTHVKAIDLTEAAEYAERWEGKK